MQILDDSLITNLETLRGTFRCFSVIHLLVPMVGNLCETSCGSDKTNKTHAHEIETKAGEGFWLTELTVESPWAAYMSR